MSLTRHAATRVRNKYGAVKTVIDNITFASKKEAARYAELKVLVRAGEIQDVEVHPRWALRAANPRATSGFDGTVVGTYTPDFSYRSYRGEDCGRLVVEDVKGGKATRTEAYRLRKKIFEANYGIVVTEIG